MNQSPRKPLPGYDQALSRILTSVEPLGSESIDLQEALGRTLYKDIHADRDQPPFDRSAMDGFAVRSNEIPRGGCWPVSGVIAAGAEPETFQALMPHGTVKRIATGAPLAHGADAVIPIEQANVTTTQQGEQVSFSLEKIDPGCNVHRRGSDAAAGDVVLKAKTCLGAWHLGIASAVGAARLKVYRRPRITLLTTGDEVRPTDTPTDQLQPQQIRNSNGPMLRALLTSWGQTPPLHEHVPDEPNATEQAAASALEHSDIILTVGGVSVGQRDWVARTWDRLNAQTLIHGVAIQPGKPVFVATHGKTLILGLPGNPVSVLATAHLFLWPILSQMTGCPAPRWHRVKLVEPVHAKAKRQVFRAARLCKAHQAQVITWHGSGDLAHTASADGWVRLPLTDQPIPAGTSVDFLSFAPR